MSVEDSPFSWGPDGPAPDDEEAAMPTKKKPSERAYARLTRHERQTIERMPDRGKGCREIAREIGRAPSTVANEVERHRFAPPTPSSPAPGAA